MSAVPLTADAIDTLVDLERLSVGSLWEWPGRATPIRYSRGEVIGDPFKWDGKWWLPMKLAAPDPKIVRASKVLRGRRLS